MSIRPKHCHLALLCLPPGLPMTLGRVMVWQHGHVPKLPSLIYQHCRQTIQPELTAAGLHAFPETAPRSTTALVFDVKPCVLTIKGPIC